jgi:hypothetical protein
MPRLASTFSGHDLADAARRSGAAQVVAYRCFLPSLPWILKRPVPVANEKGELGSDGDQPSDLFWTRDEFWSRWNSRERLAVLIKREDRGPFVQMSTEPPATVAENSRYMLLANFTPAPPGSGPVPPSMSQVGGPPHLASGR